MNNLSIITNFGCPYNCPFCITKSQRTKKEFTFDGNVQPFMKYLKENNITRVSISGGGEPLFAHSDEVIKFYRWIKELSRIVPVHVHTNLNSPKESKIGLNLFEKITVSINENLKKYENWSKINQMVRYVHVSDGKDLELIKEMVANLPANSQFTVKQMDSEDLGIFKEIQLFVNSLPNGMFLTEGDYNKYYFLDDKKLYDVFKEIQF